MDKKKENLTEKQSFPLKKIEELIKLANTYELEALVVGSIKIVPSRRSPLSPLADFRKQPPKRPDEDLEPERRELTKRQRDDIILFGEPIEPDA